MDAQVLVLIDVQKGFLEESYWGKRNNSNFESNVARLLRHWRSSGWPVIHVAHDSILELSPLRPGCIGNDFMECALPDGIEPVIRKTVNSAFIGTNLLSILRKIGAKNLVFAGLTSDHCISTSVRMAANFGFAATVVLDATATFPRRDYDGVIVESEVVHRVALASLNEEFAGIVRTETMLAKS